MFVEPGKPIRFDEVEVGASPADDDGLCSRIGKTFKAYRDSVKELLDGRYQHLRALAPPHMREPCNTTVLLCTNGMFVRYDLAEDSVPTVRVAVTDKPLAEIAPQFSDNVVHFPPDRSNYAPPGEGPRVTLAVHDRHGNATHEVITIALMVFGSTEWPEGTAIPTPPARPVCLASLTHEFDFILSGHIEDASPTSPRRVQGDPTHFVVRSRIPLLVGWRAIEVYPLLGKEHWTLDAAPMWAELDLLFALAQRNAQDNEFRAIDGRAETRTKYAALLSQFEALLGGSEEPVHQFIKGHPELLCPTYDAVWSKVPFGDRISDFVIREVPNDYVLVEIEAPVRQLFREDGQQRQELTH